MFKKATIIYLVKKSGNKITDICLAMKKRGFGEGKWNGAGGKLEENETFEEAAKRELFEELGVKAKKLSDVAEIKFNFKDKPEWNQNVHVFLCTDWENQPQESEEMKPKWFKVENIPYDEMWPADRTFIPLILDGKNIKATFSLVDNKIIETEIEEI